MVWIASLGLLIMGYLLGSIPTGYVLAKMLKGIDIRQHGSGGTGATNVLRVVGKGAAIAVLAIDLAKGALAVLAVRWLYPWVMQTENVPAALLPWLVTLVGLLAILGHSRSIWIQFTGGKSAASGLGVLLAMAWPVGLGVLGVFVSVLALSRIVSLSSISAAIAAMILMVVLGQPLPYCLMAGAGGAYVILRHRSNIQRLLAGTEPRLGQKSGQEA